MSDRHALLTVEECTFKGIEEIKANNTHLRFASNELLRKARRIYYLGLSKLRLDRSTIRENRHKKEENQLFEHIYL